MANTEKFLFETVFDTGDSVVGLPAAKPLSEKEIEELRESAFTAGVNEGVAREIQATEHRQSEALAVIADRLKPIAEAQNQAVNHIVDEATKLAVAIARKISPALARYQPLINIEAMIRDFLPQLIDEPRVIIHAPESLIDDLKRRIDAIAAECGFDGRVVLMPGSLLSGNDCRLEWADGGAVRSCDSILDSIETEITRLLNSPVDQSGDPPDDLEFDGSQQSTGAP